uniref:Putative secreted peptide n=1 Tax=Rhipicephalus microplus TaxID=6941 RepID=A0A6M2CIM9_RHIMP
MRPYVILGLLILGHLCHIQAATLSKPATSTDDARKLLAEKLSRSIMEHREELVEALKGVDSTGDGTDEQGFPLVIAAILASILTPAMAAGAGAIG